MKVYPLISTALLSVFLINCGGNDTEELEPVDVRFERGEEYFNDRKFEKAITEFTFVTFNAPGNEFGDDAQFYLAESHFELKEYIIAVSEYERLMRIHPESPLVEKGEYKKALAFDILSPKSHHDQENTLKALRAYQEFIEDWPLSELKVKAEGRLDDLRFKLAKKMFDAGKQYQKLGECKASIIYMRQLLEQYYDSEFAPKARWRIAECEMKLKEWNAALSTILDILNRDDHQETVEKAREALKKVKPKAENPGDQALVGDR